MTVPTYTTRARLPAGSYVVFASSPVELTSVHRCTFSKLCRSLGTEGQAISPTTQDKRQTLDSRTTSGLSVPPVSRSSTTSAKPPDNITAVPASRRYWICRSSGLPIREILSTLWTWIPLLISCACQGDLDNSVRTHQAPNALSNAHECETAIRHRGHAKAKLGLGIPPNPPTFPARTANWKDG